jgi:signal transduction histidine kinase
MFDRIVQRWRRVASPAWVAPFFLGTAALLGLLTQMVERGQFEPGFARASWPTPASFVLVGLYLAAWLIETSGVPWPRAIFAITTIFPAFVLLLYGRDTIAPLLPMLVVGWVAYVGARRQGALAVALTLVAFLLPFLLGRNVPNRGEYRNLLGWSIATLFSWGSGYGIASQQRLVRQLRAAQADLARQAAAEERRRIAREVHDVIAHSLAITMLHLTGARYHMTRDLQRAAEALAQAEALGRQSMADIRRTVGLLGAEATAGVAAPLPGIDDVPALIAEFCGAGLEVTYHVSGDASRLPAAASLGLYRIVQEALTNVAKHAPGAAVTVDLAIGERTVTLRVCDGGSRNGAHPLANGAGAGLGIMGMRERAALLGGALSARPSGAGWLVECTFPCEAGRS